MKKLLKGFCLAVVLGVPGFLPLQAQHTPVSEAQLMNAFTYQLVRHTDDYLAAPDKFGTPLIIQLARRGDTQFLLQTARQARSGTFLLARDKYGNNVFHTAKDAATVQALAALVRQQYGPKAPEQIRALADARNAWGETPLNAQVSAGHADTFRPIYTYTTLRLKNERAQNQLQRLNGMDERIVAQQKSIYCQEIKTLSTAGGQTILQTAQNLANQQPRLRTLAQEIRREIPCLAEENS